MKKYFICLWCGEELEETSFCSDECYENYMEEQKFYENCTPVYDESEGK